MHHVNEEVRKTLSQISEKLHAEKLCEKAELTPIDLLSVDHKELNNLLLNDYFDESLEKKFPNYEVTKTIYNKEESETNPVYDFKDGFNKSTPEKKSLNKFCVFDSHIDNKTRGFTIKYSTPGKQIKEDINFKNEDGDDGDGGDDVDRSLDKAIDEAIIKYKNLYEENKRKGKDVSVQTTYHMLETIDKQCQCELSFCNDSSFISAEDKTIKKIKLKSFGYPYESQRNGNWKYEPSEHQQIEDNKRYLEIDTTALRMKSSRIRVGLSKRVRPAPLHLLN